MSLLLRDPFMRELLMDDYDRRRHPARYHHWHHQPIRVRRFVDDAPWPVMPSFDQALNELQSVMDNVNEAIGQYHTSLVKDLESGGMRTQRTEDGNLQLAIDVSQYKPEEINVRLCDDNLVVEAKTETSENDNYHKSEFKRWIKLPADVKQEAIKSTLTPDKKLVVEVPCAKPIDQSRSRSIPIQIQQEQKKAAVEGGETNAKTNAKEQAK